MYHIYIILFFIANLWLLSKITTNFRKILLNNKIDKSYPILFNILTKDHKKKKKTNGLVKISKLIKNNIN